MTDAQIEAIAQVYARHLAAFTHRTPFGVLLQSDREALVKATARDAGCTVEAVLQSIANSEPTP